MKILKYIFVFGILGLLFSCSKSIKSSEPGFLYIDTIGLTTTYLKEGSNSHDIKDVWVYLNDDILGIFPLPAKIPVIKTGALNLKIYGGVKQNDVQIRAYRYDFYEPFSIDTIIAQGKIYKINPTLRYRTVAKFSFLEDFEGSGLNFIKTSRSDTGFFKTNDAFEGLNSGGVFLDATDNLFEVESTELRGKIHFKEPLFLEFDLKSTGNLTVGIIADGAYYPSAVIVHSSEFKKVYVNLTAAVLRNKYKKSLKLFIGISNSDTKTVVKAVIDNIKILHF